MFWYEISRVIKFFAYGKKLRKSPKNLTHGMKIGGNQKMLYMVHKYQNDQNKLNTV